MYVKVTCAAAKAEIDPGSIIEIDIHAPGKEVIEAFDRAADLAVKNKKKIFVVYK